MSEWDDFNETLQQVMTWLQQAENQLKHQEHISENVDKVKEQFRNHEVHSPSFFFPVKISIVFILFMLLFFLSGFYDDFDFTSDKCW